MMPVPASLSQILFFGGNWPLPVIRQLQKANLNTGHSDS
jgi:hypothetical protein